MGVRGDDQFFPTDGTTRVKNPTDLTKPLGVGILITKDLIKKAGSGNAMSTTGCSDPSAYV